MHKSAIIKYFDHFHINKNKDIIIISLLLSADIIQFCHMRFLDSSHPPPNDDSFVFWWKMKYLWNDIFNII